MWRLERAGALALDLTGSHTLYFDASADTDGLFNIEGGAATTP
jgi:hypothetical protein